ncbi:hypothetical protein FRC0547_02092 [Corynebacterium diphtheriae]|nr:hypothetical protein FRC0515_02027 [Corynebacterium diphtheriae]CAB1047977.1 hypothetical protein FRC0547_02092 [Corynebacterium diphtheriae]
MIVTGIKAEPINEYPTCRQPRVLRDHVIHRLLDLPIVGHPTRIHVRLPRYRCTNKCCLQKIFRTGLACAPDNSKTTDKVTRWILQHLGQCTLKPEEPPNGGISKDFSWYFTPNRKKTGRLGRFGVKCRLLGGERGWRAHQRPPTPAIPSQAMVVKNVLLRVVPRLNPRRANQCTLKPEEPPLLL